MNIKESLDVIKRHWNTAPVDVFKIARELGIEVNRVPLPENISGRIRRIDGDKFAIDVNRDHSTTRQRFTVAHEIGHYIYHRDLLGKGTGDTLAFRAEGTDLPNPNITATQERQANIFAANLLMPTHLITALKASGIRAPADLARHLGVSEQAMRIKLGLVQERQAEPEEEPDQDWPAPHL